jgi:hypothetical protein
MVTQVAGVIVLQRGPHRQLARPLSVVQQQYLTALDVPVACFTNCTSGEGEGEDCGTPLTAAEAYPALVGRRLQADTRSDHEQPSPAPVRRCLATSNPLPSQNENC